MRRGKLSRAGAHRVALKQQPDAALTAQEGDDLAHHVVEAGHRPHGLERGAVGGMLPGHTRDLREGDSGAGGGEGHACSGG